jgi:hypothetical protein
MVGADETDDELNPASLEYGVLRRRGPERATDSGAIVRVTLIATIVACEGLCAQSDHKGRALVAQRIMCSR